MAEKQNHAKHTSPFDTIRRFDLDNHEYWSARDLYKLLGYTEYGKFKNAIKKAEKSCEEGGEVVLDHFAHVSDMIEVGKGAKRPVEDVHLSRYACYLIIENADPEKPIVALGQRYFAIQTRRQELTSTNQVEDEVTMPEDQLRLIRRSQLAINNRQLAEAAKDAGVITPRDFAVFQDHGYAGLYGGLRAKDIHAKKELKKGQEILDFMGSDELTANAFRASLTRQKIQREQVKKKDKANQIHTEMGVAVRKTIIETGATLPEDLPTPQKSIQQLEREEQRRMEQQLQPSLFPELEEPGRKSNDQRVEM